MRNFIEEDTCEKSDADKDNPSTRDFHTENPRKAIVNLLQLLRDKISKNEIFYSFEIVSTKKPGAFYRRSV